MIEGHCSRFFMRPCWQQQFFLLIITALLFSVSYCVLLVPNQYRLHQLRQDAVNLQNRVNLINNQITNKPDKEELMVAIEMLRTTTSAIALVDMQNQLISVTKSAGIELKEAAPIVDAHKLGWKIQLSGQYQQFVLFLAEFYKKNLTVKIHHIEVKVESDQPLFSLVILSK